MSSRWWGGGGWVLGGGAGEWVQEPIGWVGACGTFSMMGMANISEDVRRWMRTVFLSPNMYSGDNHEFFWSTRMASRICTYATKESSKNVTESC